MSSSSSVELPSFLRAPANPFVEQPWSSLACWSRRLALVSDTFSELVDGGGHEFARGVDVEFGVDVLEVGADGGLRRSEALGDVPATGARPDQSGDPQLLWGEVAVGCSSTSTPRPTVFDAMRLSAVGTMSPTSPWNRNRGWTGCVSEPHRVSRICRFRA
jgi:hypothetical protein